MPQFVYGIDLAKHIFSIHGEDHQSKILIHKTIIRTKLLSTFTKIPAAITGMEASDTPSITILILDYQQHKP